MARGLAKVQSQEKHAKKLAKVAVPVDGKAARAAQLKYQCAVCKVRPTAMTGTVIANRCKTPKADSS